MPKVNIAHIGDAHLGKKQYGIKEREEDFRVALTHCFKDAAKNSAEVIILPGDIFDSPKPSPANVTHLANLVRTFNGVVLGIDGNHDGSADGSWLDTCGIVNLDRCSYTVHGVTFAGIRGHRPNVFKEELSKLVNYMVDNDKTVDVFVMHQSVAEMCGFTGVELTAQWVAEQLNVIGVKYVAMGDIHDYSLKEFEGITFCYPGSCELTSLGESLEKYWVNVCIDTEAAQGVTTKKIGIPTRPIKSYIINNQDELTKMVTDVRRNYQDHLVFVEVSTEVIDGHKTTYRMLNTDNNVMTRVTLFNPAKAMDTEIASIPLWEKAEANNAVESAIAQCHAKGTNQYQMIVSLLNSPQAVNTICQEWLNDTN